MYGEFAICHKCQHLIDAVEPRPEPGDAPEFKHIHDGTQNFNHDPYPEDAWQELDVWRVEMPYLFETFPDGRIGPNSPMSSYHAMGKRAVTTEETKSDET